MAEAAFPKIAVENEIPLKCPCSFPKHVDEPLFFSESGFQVQYLIQTHVPWGNGFKYSMRWLGNSIRSSVA